MTLVVVLLVLPIVAAAQGWPTYGGDGGGKRYSAAGLVTRANVHLLAPTWTFHTSATPASLRCRPLTGTRCLRRGRGSNLSVGEERVVAKACNSMGCVIDAAYVGGTQASVKT